MLGKLSKIIQYLPENSIITGGLGLALHGIDLKRTMGDILYYKAKYAMKGNIKHINDIKNILKYGV